jgi:phosphatidylglycerol:prolipoprotein diacylglycerol transferase
MLYTKLDRRKINPRLLGIIIFVTGIVLSIALFVPMSNFFSGQWKVNQKVELARNVILDFDSVGFGGIATSLGMERQLPIGTVSIRFYAITILLGVILGYLLTLYLSRTQYIAGTIIDRMIIGLIIFGLIGARLFFVAFNWEYYQEQPLTIATEIVSGGLALFGMLIFNLIYLWVYCSRFKFNFFEFADLISPGLVLGQVIGRFGNFFNYESYGPETSAYWKMFVPPGAPFYEGVDLNSRFFHPTFLYEIIPNFLLLVFLLYYYQKLTEKHSGLVFAIYAIGYGVIRYFVEFFRLDALKIPLPSYLQIKFSDIFTLQNLLASQMIALLLIIIGVVIWFTRSNVIYIKKSMKEYKVS